MSRYEHMRMIVQKEFEEGLKKLGPRILELAKILEEEGYEKHRIARQIVKDFAHFASRTWIYKVLPDEYKTVTKPRRQEIPRVESSMHSGTCLQSLPQANDREISKEWKDNLPLVKQSTTPMLTRTMLTEKELQIIYVEFRKGKNPVDIVAEQVFPFDLVIAEYEKYVKYTNCNIIELQRDFITSFPNTIKAAGPEAQELGMKFSRQGFLTNEEFSELIIILFELFMNRNTSTDPISELLNRGWERTICSACSEPLNGVLVNPNTKLGRSVSDHVKYTWKHKLCQ